MDVCATRYSLAVVADAADVSVAVVVVAAAAEGGSAQWGSGFLQRSAPGGKDGSVAVERADVTGHW